MKSIRAIEAEYTQGREALENFEQGMKALFKVSKDKVLKRLKKQQEKRATSRKSKNANKD